MAKFPLWGQVSQAGLLWMRCTRGFDGDGPARSRCVFVLIGSIFRMGLTSYRHATDQFSRGVALGFLLGFVALLVHAVGSNAFLIVRIMEPFWLFAALVVRSYMLAAGGQPAKSEEIATWAKGKEIGVSGGPSVRPWLARSRNGSPRLVRPD